MFRHYEKRPLVFVLLRYAKGKALAYVYYEDEKGWQIAMHRLRRDEARRIAANIANLPTLKG
jgi:hypothetical protein